MLHSLPLLVALAAAAPQCAVPAGERDRQLSLGYDAFDSVSAAFGWRTLNGRGCIDEAVGLLRAYRATNMHRLTPQQRLESAFHIGQAYAFADRADEALAAFIAADAQDAPEEWRAYVAAHVAFFRRDKAALADARRRYAAGSSPGAMRLKFIDGLFQCSDKSYMEAVHCAM